jgi:hypothetical protein
MKQTKKGISRNVIGRRLRQARLKASPAISQDDLSARLATVGVILDRSAISRIQSGTRYVLDYEVAAIAKALRVPIQALFAA